MSRIVILRAAENHLATLDHREKILRCAQADTWFIPLHNDGPVISQLGMTI